MRWAVLLAGGAGTRFWPLSTPTRPKQLLPLAGSRSSAAEAVARLDGLIDRARILVVTNAELARAFRDDLGLPPENVLAEPRPAGTAPALTWATWEAHRRDPEATILSTHTDWHVPDPRGFVTASRAALDAAEQSDLLVTVGIVPTRVETGYGHIVPAAGGNGVQPVARFVEKPPTALAQELLAAGALWNSGIFAWTAARFLAEVATHAPEIGEAVPQLEAPGGVDQFFARVPVSTVDVSVLERSDRVGVVPGEFSWDDIGTWEALFRVRDTDTRGNVQQGPGWLGPDTRESLVWSDGPPIVIEGVQGLVVVAANGRILVLPRERAGQLKAVLDELPPAIREVSS